LSFLDLIKHAVDATTSLMEEAYKLAADILNQDAMAKDG
jgi:hypothetical protein